MNEVNDIIANHDIEDVFNNNCKGEFALPYILERFLDECKIIYRDLISKDSIKFNNDNKIFTINSDEDICIFYKLFTVLPEIDSDNKYEENIPYKLCYNEKVIGKVIYRYIGETHFRGTELKPGSNVEIILEKKFDDFVKINMNLNKKKEERITMNHKYLNYIVDRLYNEYVKYNYSNASRIKVMDETIKNMVSPVHPNINKAKLLDIKNDIANALNNYTGIHSFIGYNEELYIEIHTNNSIYSLT